MAFVVFANHGLVRGKVRHAPDLMDGDRGALPHVFAALNVNALDQANRLKPAQAGSWNCAVWSDLWNRAVPIRTDDFELIEQGDVAIAALCLAGRACHADAAGVKGGRAGLLGRGN